MKLVSPPFFRVNFLRKNKRNENSAGFASAQFVGLMGLSIVVLATLVNIFFVEYTRSVTLTSLRDAARAGTRVVDLSRVYGTPAQDEAIVECEERLQNSIEQLFSAGVNSEITCEIIEDTSSGSPRYSMRASIEPKGVYFVPWAKAFAGRLNNLSASYEQRQVADNQSPDDLIEEEDTDECPPDEVCGTPTTSPETSTTSTTTTSPPPTTTTTTSPWAVPNA